MLQKHIDTLHSEVPGNYYDYYIEHNLLQRYWHKKRFEEMKKLLSSIKANNILDVGCHGGRFTSEYARYFPNAKIFGIDISAKAIEYAKRKYPQIHFRCGNAENLPYPEGIFDLVVCLEVLEHIENPEMVLHEMKSVLKKKGKLVVLVPTENLLFQLIWFFWIRIGPGRVWNHTHVQKFQGKNLDQELIKAGFKIKKRKLFLLNMLLVIEAFK